MTAKKTEDGLGAKLEAAVAAMLVQVNGPKVDVELKLKVFDRALKYWAVKNKPGDPSLGSGWNDKPEGEDE